MSISISNIGQSMATDGRINFTARSERVPIQNSNSSPNEEAADVVQYLAKDMDEVKKQISQQVSDVQKLSDMMGHKLHFSINEELQEVVVSIIDTETNKVIREIPSEDMQKLHARMQQNINFLLDEQA